MDLIATNIAVKKMNENQIKKVNPSHKSCCTPSSSTLVFYIAIGIFAAYLSWVCNTESGIPFLEKVMWAFLSYVFSIPFLVYYILIRSHQCSKLYKHGKHSKQTSSSSFCGSSFTHRKNNH